MHPEAFAWIVSEVARLSGVRSVLEIGSQDINGSASVLFESDVRYVGVDVREGKGVDLVIDLAEPDGLPKLAQAAGMTVSPQMIDGWRELRPGFDLVICTEVLEHARLPYRLVDAAWQAAKNHGTVLITCAAEPRAPHSAIDGGALQSNEHYANVVPDELRTWLLRYAKAQVVYHHRRGDLYAVAVKDHDWPTYLHIHGGGGMSQAGQP
jgi:hypothetical protein